MGTDFIDVELQLLREENARLNRLEMASYRTEEAEMLRNRNEELRKKYDQPHTELLQFMAGKAKKLGFTIQTGGKHEASSRSFG